MSESEDKRSEAEKRWHWERALANSRISGHKPSAEFLADIEANIKGELSKDELRRRILHRALDGQAAQLDRVDTYEQLVERCQVSVGRDNSPEGG